MDISQALKDTENSLRDFIAASLSRKLGDDWVDKCGVSHERIEEWRKRKAAEEKRQEAGVVEERILYYADFYDLETILEKHWNGDFSEALGELKRFKVLFEELKRFRDPDAHRRELLPHQKHLVIGIAGEIGSRIVRWRSKRETADDCFPRIESVRDNLGNIWVPNQSELPVVLTRLTLHPGDKLDFVVTARDPEETPIEYRVEPSGSKAKEWQDTGAFSITLTEEHIASRFVVHFFIRSLRSYHAQGRFDDTVRFFYAVLPNRNPVVDPESV